MESNMYIISYKILVKIIFSIQKLYFSLRKTPVFSLHICAIFIDYLYCIYVISIVTPLTNLLGSWCFYLALYLTRYDQSQQHYISFSPKSHFKMNEMEQNIIQMQTNFSNNYFIHHNFIAHQPCQLLPFLFRNNPK